MVGSFFLRPLSFFESCPQYFGCVHIPSAISHRVSYHSGEAMILKKSKCQIIQSEMTEDRTRVNLNDKNLGYFS